MSRRTPRLEKKGRSHESITCGSIESREISSAEPERAPLHGAQAGRLDQGREQARHARRVLHRPEGRRQEVLVRVARRQHKPPQPRGMLGRDQLADRAPGVVADQGHVLEVQRGDEVGHDPRDAGRREIRVRAHRHAVGAEWEVRDDAAELTLQQRGHLPPQGSVDEQPVDEHERLAGAGVAVADRARGEADLFRGGVGLGHLCLLGSGFHTVGTGASLALAPHGESEPSVASPAL